MSSLYTLKATLTVAGVLTSQPAAEAFVRAINKAHAWQDGTFSTITSIQPGLLPNTYAFDSTRLGAMMDSLLHVLESNAISYHWSRGSSKRILAGHTVFTPALSRNHINVHNFGLLFANDTIPPPFSPEEVLEMGRGMALGLFAYAPSAHEQLRLRSQYPQQWAYNQALEGEPLET